MKGRARAGALAERALRRLRAAPASRRRPFTCDLSVDELVMIEHAGLEPLQLVMGSCVVSVARRPPFETGELGYATEAVYRARHGAIEELRKESARLRAHGVIGVRIEIDAERWGDDLHEFVALGTAVRSRTESLRSDGRPFSSHLSGQAVAALLGAGCRPVSLVMGAAVWGVPVVDPTPRLGRGARGGELTRITDELTTARELAIRRMTYEARAVRATGVVGVGIEQRAYAWSGRVLEFIALGTAIRREGRATAGPSRAVVPLDAPGRRAAEIRVAVAPWQRLDN